MRRLIAIAVALAATVAFLAAGPGDAEDTYEVRAIFDNAAFLAGDMEVRIAGARVGSISELDVTFPHDPAREDGSPEPGKAVVVMRIDDPAFQDFRQDAGCTIHPQSILGEKFVECLPTQPRAAGSPAPPELEAIADGERGEGQRLLPLERNGKTVDLDLVNNIMREPYPDRFRLVLNDLGAGLAARGDELAEIIERSNPALRETNEVLAILARQNRSLESLASDSDAIMTALARERERLAAFINQATTVGEATAARRAELEATFARFPGFLRELRSTMRELTAFSGEATPVFGDLGGAAPSLTRASRALEPFATGATRAFTTLGEGAEDAGPALRASDPVIRQTRDLAQSAAPATRELSLVFSTLRQTGGFRGLMEAIYGLGGTINAFDGVGHFARAVLPTNICFDYTSISQAGCSAKFTNASGSSALRALARSVLEPVGSDEQGARRDRKRPARPEQDGAGGSQAPEPTEPPAGAPAPGAPDARAGLGRQRERAMGDLMDFLIGPEEKAR